MKKNIIIVLSLLCAIFLVTSILAINSDAYATAKKFIQNDAQLTNDIGSIEDINFNFFDYHIKNNGDFGSAYFNLLVEGENENAVVYIKLHKKNNIWYVVEIKRKP